MAYIVLTVLLWLAVAGGVAYAFAGGDTAGWFMRAFGIVLVLFLFNGLAKLLFVLFGYIGRRTGRGRAMGITAAVCCSLLGAVLLYGLTVGRSRIRVERVEVASSRLPAGFDGFRVAMFSDVHTGLLLGRDRAGKVYALKDICPHRAAPLSAGKLTREADGAESVECPYHGWRFRTDGACAAIPSLVDDQAMDVSRIRVRNYPAVESQGLVFVWISSDPRFTGEPSEPPPVFPGVVGGGPKLVDRMDFDAHIDHAVVGLMDPAHGPYVHQQWWWRSAKSQHPLPNFSWAIMGFQSKICRPSSRPVHWV